jgi:uncharacterized membrane protein YgcG
MSASHQTHQLDLKGLVLTDNKPPSKERLYPKIHGSDSHSPDYDWVTAFPKCLIWAQGKQVDAILNGNIKLETRKDIESGIVTDARLHAREFLNKKLDAQTEETYTKVVRKAQEHHALPYLEMEQTSVPASVHMRLTQEEKLIFTISSVDEIQNDPEQFGTIDIYNIENRWRRKVVYNWKRLNEKQLTYKLPANENVHESDFEHLSEDALMNIIRSQGNLLTELNTSMQSCNDIILNKLKHVRPVMMNCVKLFEDIVKEVNLHHSTMTIQLVNNFEYAEAWDVFVQNRTDSIRRHPDCLHMINLHYVQLTWNDKTDRSFSDFWNEIKSRQCSLWLLTQTLSPERYDQTLIDSDENTEEPNGKLPPLSLNEMLVALDVMTDEQFEAKHPNRLHHFPEHERLTTLMFKLRHYSPKWREICLKYETKYSYSNSRSMGNFHEYLDDHFTNNAEDHQQLNSSKQKSQGSEHSLEEYATGHNTAHIASQEKTEQVANPCQLCTYWLEACRDRNLLSDTTLIPGKRKPQPGYHSTEQCKFLRVNNTRGNIDKHCHPLPLDEILKPIDYQYHNQEWKRISKQDIDKKIENYHKSAFKVSKRPRQGSSGNSQTSDSRPHKSSNFKPTDYNLDQHGNRSNQGGGGGGGGDRSSRGGGSSGKGNNSGRDSGRQTYAAATNSGYRTNHQQNPQGQQRTDYRDQNRRDQSGGYNSQNNQRRYDSENQAHYANHSQSYVDRNALPPHLQQYGQGGDDYRSNQCPDRNSEDDLP